MIDIIDHAGRPENEGKNGDMRGSSAWGSWGVIIPSYGTSRMHHRVHLGYKISLPINSLVPT